MRKVVLGALALVLAACAEPPRVGELKVCLGVEDPPRAAVNGGGFDVDVAHLFASRMNRTLEIVWQPKPVMTEIESTDLDFGPLIEGRCDLMLSIPGPDALVGAERLVELSAPYYGTGFELVPRDGKLTKEAIVAVRANTVAHVVIDARGHRWTMQPDSFAIAEAVQSGAADVGLVWGPELALLNLKPSDSFEPPQILRWNQHAITRKGDPLADLVNDAIADTEKDVLELLRLHNMPAHEPYATTHQQEALRNL